MSISLDVFIRHRDLPKAIGLSKRILENRLSDEETLKEVDNFIVAITASPPKGGSRRKGF